MTQYIAITDDESKADNLVEVPLEDDGLLLVSTLESQFAGASGLKYRASSGAFRGLRVSDDKVNPPNEGWEAASSYVVVCTAKRKADSSLDGPPAKVARAKIEPDVTDSDLIVLGIPYTFTTADLQAFFSQFGQLKVCQVVLDNKTGQSKGFGFIRFVDGEVNKSVEATKFYQVGGRHCEVKLPQRRSAGGQSTVTKLFVGCLTQQITRDDLLAYFAMYGEVTDVYVPSPFRGFAFITFADPRSASAALDTGNHVLNGVQINVTVPNPRKKDNSSSQVANQLASQALTSQAILQQLALAGTGLNSASLSGAAGLGAAGLGLDLNTLSSLASLGGAAALANPASSASTSKATPTSTYKW